MEQSTEINDDDLVEFIFEKLVEKGIDREDILTILDLELMFMVKLGLATPLEQEG